MGIWPNSTDFGVCLRYPFGVVFLGVSATTKSKATAYISEPPGHQTGA